MSENALPPDLLPCPFCGGKAMFGQVDVEADNPNAGAEYVECESCGVATGLFFPSTAPGNVPIARWNRRALPPDEREALAAEVKRLARECTHRMATTANWHSLDAAIDRLARLAVQGGDAGQTDSLGASHFVGPGSAASRPEPLCVSALRAPIPGAEGE